MTSANAPSPYFNGITYNPSFFSSSSTSSGITIGAANALYLRKAYADTATSLETFSGGINTTTIKAYNYDSVSAVSSLTIGAGQTGVGGGSLNIGTTATRTGLINIGNNVVPIDIEGPITTSGSTFSMIYGATGTITAGSLSLNSIYGNVSIDAPSSSAINLGATSTTGIINIGTGGRNQNINIGTGATGGTLSLGSTSMPVSILGSSTLASVSTAGAITTSAGDIQATTGKIKTGTLDAVTDTAAGTTALKIGSNILLGDIEIGNAQTTGDIKIGLSDASGATITVGTSATATTINGTLTTGAIGGGAITGTSFIGPTYNGTAGNATDMSFGASQTTGNIAIGGSQAGASTTGRINIGINSTSDVYIGSANSATAGTNLGACHINKCQFGALGTYFRCVIVGTWTTSTANGTATIPSAPTTFGNPYVFASININTTGYYGVQVYPTGTTTFSYSKWFWGSNILNGATAESFNYIAIWL